MVCCHLVQKRFMFWVETRGQLSPLFLSCFPLYFYLLLVLDQFTHNPPSAQWNSSLSKFPPILMPPCPSLFPETGSQITLEISDSARLADKQASGILLCPSLQFWNYRPALSHPASPGVLGIQTWAFFMLARQALYCLSPLFRNNF